MRICARFNDRSPVTLEDAWQVQIEIDGVMYEITPQMVDRDEPKALLGVIDIGKSLVIIPHGSNSIRFGAKR